MNLDELERFVLDAVASYRYEVSDGALGRAFSADKVERHLAEMRAARDVGVDGDAVGCWMAR